MMLYTDYFLSDASLLYNLDVFIAFTLLLEAV